MPKSIHEHVADLKAIMDRILDHVTATFMPPGEQLTDLGIKARLLEDVEAEYEEWIEGGGTGVAPDDPELIELFRMRARTEDRILAITEEIPDVRDTLQ
jgi:hypothetical protein